MTLEQITRLAQTNALAAWLPLNEWLSRNVSRVSDARLRQALDLRDDLSRIVETRPARIATLTRRAA